MKTSKNIPLDKLTPIHLIRSQEKVDNLVNNFDPDLASPILIGYDGNLLNGTHRYRAYLLRDMKGLTPNFEFVYLEDLIGWVKDEICNKLSDMDQSDDADNTEQYVDIDHFWNDNWDFAEYSI